MAHVRAENGGLLIGVKTQTFTIFNQEKYDSKVIPAAWSEFMDRYRTSDFLKSSTFYSAAIPSMSMDVPMDYYAGVIVPVETPVPVGFDSVEIPAGNYFCVDHVGPITKLGETFGKAYGVELPQSGLEMRNAPHLEIYESDKDSMSDDYEMIVAIPVN